MPNNNKKNSIYAIDVTEYIVKLFSIGIPLLLLGVCFFTYFKFYKPKEKSYIKKTKYAYSEISDIVHEFHRNKSLSDYAKVSGIDDKMCLEIAKRLSLDTPKCSINNGLLAENFKIKKTNITVYGLDYPAYQAGSMVKDFIIDVNGEKGENELGVDRTIFRIYLNNEMRGIITPVNCDHKEEINYGLIRSKLCPNGVETNFLASNIPIGFDVNQINTDTGKIRQITTNVSFLRADCAGLGGELLADEYCSDKNFYWLKSCYAEFFCNIDYAK